MSDHGPRRKRARLWAGLYAALFGVEEDESDRETESERERDPQPTTGGSDG